MPTSDAQRWDARYQDKIRFSFEEPRAFLVQNAHLLPSSGVALDIAMGLGGNTAFLLERGLSVVGVDISGEALRRAKARLPNVWAVQADLTQFHLPVATFDVVINFYYLQRDLWPRMLHATKPGGLVMIETLTQEMNAIHPEIDPDYLLAPGELLQAFQKERILSYREGWQEMGQPHPRCVASIIVRTSEQIKREPAG